MITENSVIKRENDLSSVRGCLRGIVNKYTTKTVPNYGLGKIFLGELLFGSGLLVLFGLLFGFGSIFLASFIL